MSHLFWSLTIIYCICYALCILGVAIGSGRKYIGLVMAIGAVLYLFSAFAGLVV